MEADVVVWLIFIAIWFVGGVIKQLKQVASKKPGQQPQTAEPRHESFQEQRRREQAEQRRQQQQRRPQAQQRAPQPGDALTQLLRQLGVEEVGQPEPVVVSEHQGSYGEHMRTQSESLRTRSEHEGTLSEHRHTASSHRQVATEHAWTQGEHSMSASEHRRGDVVPVVPGDVAAGAGPRSRSSSAAGIARAIRGDLRSPRATARAIVLREILGPPPGLSGGPRGGPR